MKEAAGLGRTRWVAARSTTSIERGSAVRNRSASNEFGARGTLNSVTLSLAYSSPEVPNGVD
jgi:hypothetical protein